MCKFLLIPIDNISECENKNFKIITKKDLIKGLSKSKSEGFFDVSKKVDSEKNSTNEESLNNIACLGNHDINQVSVQEYFKKYDSSLAKIKKNVERLEKQNRSRLN